MIQLALLLTAVSSVLIGFVVFLNNPRSSLFKVYFLFSVTSALWMCINAVVIIEPASLSSRALLVISQLITPLSLLTLFSFYVFLKLFSSARLGIETFFQAAPTLVIISFSFSPYNVYLNSAGDPTLGKLYPVYLIGLAYNVSLVFYALYSSRVVSYGSDISKREQITNLRLGAYSAIIPGLIFGSIIPLFSTSNISNLGPLFSVFFVVYSGIAIVKHKLFGVRFYVVRAALYLLMVLALGILYVAPVVYLIAILIMGIEFEPYRFIAGVFSITLIALYFESLRVWFDKITSRIFYRDSYDSAAVLGELNRILVSSIELSTMLHSSSALIASTFKADYCVFVLNGNEKSAQRIIGTSNKQIPQARLSKTLEHMRALGLEMVVADVIGDKDVELKKNLRKSNAAAIIKLSSKVIENDEGLGFIVIGFKKSGNAYNNKDLQTFGAMADVVTIGVQNALRFEEIQNFNVTLQNRIEEATLRLRRINAKLEALDETKDDFISMASHQLRTPLTSVKGYLSMVLDGDAGKINADQRKMLDQAFVSSQRMVFLIADLLNISRLKTGKFVIEPAKVSLAQLVSDEVKQLKETAKSRSLELVYDKPADFPLLMLDETKTRQVIMNFIDNAIYYTPAGGTITVSLIDRPDSVELKVSDTGIGVPKTEQPHLFTKFYRAGNARRARPDGTGLGLFMAKKVIVAQGGAVIFDSREGKGSNFGFVFPKSKVGVPESV